MTAFSFLSQLSLKLGSSKKNLVTAGHSNRIVLLSGSHNPGQSFILEMFYWYMNPNKKALSLIQWAGRQWTLLNLTLSDHRKSSCPTPYGHPCPWECQCVLLVNVCCLLIYCTREEKQRPHQACVYFWSHYMMTFFIAFCVNPQFPRPFALK